MQTHEKKNPQISAHVSQGVKTKLDKLSKVRGLRKAFILEQALVYHFRAMEEMPEEAFLPARIILPQKSFGDITESLKNPPPATKKMQELMNEYSDQTIAQE
jgi:uncharacterized protein (DUF1778 family)